MAYTCPGCRAPDEEKKSCCGGDMEEVEEVEEVEEEKEKGEDEEDFEEELKNE